MALSSFVSEKRKMLTGVQTEWLDFSDLKTQPLEGLMWIDPTKDPLSWIIAKSTSKKYDFWDLIMNCLDLTVKELITAYKDRWSIKEISKWLKQYTNMKWPFIESWDGFIYPSLLLYNDFSSPTAMLLALLGIPRWQENLTELWRQLHSSIDQPLNLYTLWISVEFFIEEVS